MTIKRNWFVHLALAVFEICAAYALISAMEQLAASQTHPFLWQAGVLCALALGFGLVSMACRFLARHRPFTVPPWQKRKRTGERIIVILVLLLSAALRIWTIVKLPISPSSDFHTYYQVAELLAKGGLSGSGYSGYIAEFPHVIGYPFILSLVFRFTGPSLWGGLLLNLAASLLSVFLTYRIARSLGGRLTGMLALLAAAFWPSQILYGTILGSEAVFTCMLLVCVALFLYLYRYPVSLGNRENAVFLCVALGVASALTNAIRPLAILLMIAAILCVVPFIARFNQNEKMLNGRLSRASCQGWFLALAISLSFLATNQMISASISNTIAYPLPGTAASFGYNLMIGVNIDSKGTWNQEDADFFAKTFASTNSPQAAHEAARQVALERIGKDPLGVLNLAVEKFRMLWGNDDYGDTWTSLFLGQQGNLTPERQSIIDWFTRVNDVFYLFALFFSGVFGLTLFRRKKMRPVQVLILLFVGTAVLHMLLESQNRYHYFILPVFAILAALGVGEMYRGAVRRQRQD